MEERSWSTFPEFERITNLQRAVERAVTSGVATQPEVDAWLGVLHDFATRGEFRAEIAKVLWVAAAP